MDLSSLLFVLVLGEDVGLNCWVKPFNSAGEPYWLLFSLSGTLERDNKVSLWRSDPKDSGLEPSEPSLTRVCGGRHFDLKVVHEGDQMTLGDGREFRRRSKPRDPDRQDLGVVWTASSFSTALTNSGNQRCGSR